MRTVVVSGVGLLLAGILPYICYSAPEWWRSQQGPAAATATAPTTPTSADLVAQAVTAAMGNPASAAQASPLSATPLLSLPDSLRFDVSPQWVVHNWPRVTTGLSQLQLQGYRVPLVSGTGEDDVAGAATYYFNPQQQVQRITFYGTTGNPQKLVAFLAARYGFVRRVVNSPAMHVYEVPDPNGQAARSSCRVEVSDVMRATEPLKRYRVSLVLERPA